MSDALTEIYRGTYFDKIDKNSAPTKNKYVSEFDPQTGVPFKTTWFQKDHKTINSIVELDPITGGRVRQVNYYDDGQTIKAIIQYNPQTGDKVKVIFYKQDGKAID
ncbi:MAG: DUF2963 domain-containing protein [Sweet potato little leaf phytoplasma]|nr:DUF2963 domain-containing protein [Pigeon pea little leaf phytoplasma]MDV3196833.1 DUF2963 domain-containing protein [Pigeon pea little leaf phytoplasma]MDV3204575.1 DUF2963 domain-containing protein [Sweet potato little leaf phytoplasma]